MLSDLPADMARVVYGYLQLDSVDEKGRVRLLCIHMSGLLQKSLVGDGAISVNQGYVIEHSCLP